jgi:hypothetical protein
VLTGAIVVVLVLIAGFVIWKLFGFFRRALGKVREGYRRAVAAVEPGTG